MTDAQQLWLIQALQRRARDGFSCEIRRVGMMYLVAYNKTRIESSVLFPLMILPKPSNAPEQQTTTSAYLGKNSITESKSSGRQSLWITVSHGKSIAVFATEFWLDRIAHLKV